MREKHEADAVAEVEAAENADTPQLYFEDLAEPAQEVILDLLASILKNAESKKEAL